MRNKNGHLFISKNTVIEQLREDLNAFLNYLKSKRLLLEANTGEFLKETEEEIRLLGNSKIMDTGKSLD